MQCNELNSIIVEHKKKNLKICTNEFEHKNMLKCLH